MDGWYSNLWMKFRGFIYALHGGANRMNMVKDAGTQMEMQNAFSCVILWETRDLMRSAE